MKKAWVYVLLGTGIFAFLLLMLFLMIGMAVVFLGQSNDIEVKGRGNVALIPIKGVIVTEPQFGVLSPDEESSQDIIELIERADSSPYIDAIIFEINSPGGSAVASEEISNAVKKIQKPKVAWIRESGASGAYWIATSADHIVASKISLVGSIGVTASYLEFGGLLNDYNVTYERMVAGKYKDIGTPFRELTEEEREKFQHELDLIHGEFIAEVSQNRNLPEDSVRQLATGEVFLGREALELGLVDEIGSKDEAVAYLEGQLGKSVSVVEYKRRRGLLDSFSEATNEKFFQIGRGIGTSMRPEQMGLQIRT